MLEECGVLFHSAAFLFVFLPVVLAGFFSLGRRRPRWAEAWLVLASLFFYGWWSPVFLPLLLGSVLFNFWLGRGLALHGRPGLGWQRAGLALGVAGNLALLAYFKYAHFLLGSMNAALGLHWPLPDIILPLGISFFTFTQIAFLVDAARGRAHEPDLLHYTLFVSYFPHLVAGPVLHHAEMMPQFARPQTYTPQLQCWVPGLTLFILGLFKKVVLADGIAPYVAGPFDAAAAGLVPGLLQAWGGTLAYTLQLYFDFSGYSDMALGLSYLLGVRLPQNFNSPYQATDIADFWNRWHMSLSRFLRDYLYIPLGGNRKGTPRRYANLLLTMVLGGLWHGAAWTYVCWGAWHGAALVLYQGWHQWRTRTGVAPARSSRLARALARLLTLAVVVAGWVWFRASDVPAALNMLHALAGGGGVQLPMGVGAHLGWAMPWLLGKGVLLTPESGRELLGMMVWVMALLPLVLWAPNTQQCMARYWPALQPARQEQVRHGADQLAPWLWYPARGWALVMAAVLVMDLLSLAQPSAFLYFQF